MRAPMVSVVGYRLEPGRVTRWRHGAYAVPDAYVDAVRRAGGLPAVVHPVDVDLDRTDALLLIGGGDVDPIRYGAPVSNAVYGVEPERDEEETELLRGAIERGVPVLAICRGIQVLNVAFGGTLIVDLPSAGEFGAHGVPGGDATLHEIELKPDSRVASAMHATRVTASCHHHQGVDRVGDGLVATGWARDGLVEVVELEGASWVVGVQWHPEDTAAVDAAQQGLFDALLAQVATR